MRHTEHLSKRLFCALAGGLGVKSVYAAAGERITDIEEKKKRHPPAGRRADRPLPTVKWYQTGGSYLGEVCR